MTGTLYEKPRFRLCGDRALLVEYGDGIDLVVNEKVRAVTALLKKESWRGIETVLPAYRCLMIIYNSEETNPGTLADGLLSLEERLGTAEIPLPRTIDMPVCYGGVYGPDLEDVAACHDLTPDQVVDIHSATVYHIFMLGFAPGFCYLGGLDERLHTPRRTTPRTKLPAGSVGIAEAQTGMYPLDSPGGWRIIGRTPLKLFAPERENPFLYQAGDKIRFRPVSPAEYERLDERVVTT